MDETNEAQWPYICGFKFKTTSNKRKLEDMINSNVNGEIRNDQQSTNLNQQSNNQVQGIDTCHDGINIPNHEQICQLEGDILIQNQDLNIPIRWRSSRQKNL